MLDRVPYWMLISALFTPGPLILASAFGATSIQIALSPVGGMLVGFIAAYFILRDYKLSLSATWADVKEAGLRKGRTEP